MKMELLRYYVSKHEGTAVRRISEAAEGSGLAERVELMEDAHLVWLNTPIKRQKSVQKCYNHIIGASILENKAKLAILQERMALPTLKSVIIKQGVSWSCKPGERWVAKDPTANSGVGLWFLEKNNGTTEMVWDRDMILQQYLEYPRLWHGRKAQYRCYAILKAGGEAWLYRGRMLQVCAKPYGDGLSFQDHRVHVTNVATNIDDPFFTPEMPEMMEIADPGGDFNKIARLVADLANAAAPFLFAASTHHFELCGIDILFDSMTNNPWLIEINCPPNNAGSMPQGSVEHFHSTLYRELLSAFVRELPSPNWIQVRSAISVATPTLTSRFKHTARWRQFLDLRDACAQICKMRQQNNNLSVTFDRTEYYDFFSTKKTTLPDIIFLENAGGSQVPRCVTQAVSNALNARWREVHGAMIKAKARALVSEFVSEATFIFFAANATAIFRQLSSMLKSDIIVCCCEESHNANNRETWGNKALLVSLVDNEQWPWAHVYAIPHASNVTGEVYNLVHLVRQIRNVNPHAFIVCDGVAMAPHRRPSSHLVDAYVVAFHKAFGPHLAACCCPRPLAQEIFSCANNYDEKSLTRIWEPGSISTEALAGVIALLDEYFCGVFEAYESAYAYFRSAETIPFYRLLVFLASNPKVHILSSTPGNYFETSSIIIDHLPVVAFVHASLSPSVIADAATVHNIAIRAGDFLAPRLLERCTASQRGKQRKTMIKREKTPIAVRISLAHYNTLEDLHSLFVLLTSLPGWQD